MSLAILKRIEALEIRQPPPPSERESIVFRVGKCQGAECELVSPEALGWGSPDPHRHVDVAFMMPKREFPLRSI